jgi:hypothetical protein
MNANGKGIFVWQPSTLAKSPDEFIALLVSMNIERVELKCAEGSEIFTLPEGITKFSPWWSSTRESIHPSLVTAIRAAGIKCFGWGFNYGYMPIGEAAIAEKQSDRLGLDGWIFDVEETFLSADADKTYTAAKRKATQLTKELTRLNFPPSGFPLGFCSFARWHNPYYKDYIWWSPDVIKIFMGVCNFYMPMAYWYDCITPDAVSNFLSVVQKQTRELTEAPIIPTGRAYNNIGPIDPKTKAPKPEFTGIVSNELMRAFEAQNFVLGNPGVSWWALDSVILKPEYPDIRATLAAMPKYNDKASAKKREFLAPTEYGRNIMVRALPIEHGKLDHDGCI